MNVIENNIKKVGVIFEADDVNDEAWEEIIGILYCNGYKVGFGDGNYMSFFREESK